MIYAVGVDLVEVARIDGILVRWKKRFTERVYSEVEIAYCEKRAHPSIHFAGRFAVKEAFLKCIGSGILGGFRLKDIEVRNTPGGKPVLKLHNKARDVIGENGITDVHVSISHSDSYATAVVILEKRLDYK